MPDSGPTDFRPPALRSELTVQDMSAAGDDVWAVGRSGFPGPALIAHSAAGQPWQLTPYTASGGAMFTDLAGVHAISGTDVWGVGSDEVPSRMHIARGDGTGWHPAGRPGGADSSSLSAVAAAAPGDALAVGARRPGPGPGSPALPPLAAWETLAVRWDGTRWAAVPSPGSGHGILSSICAAGPGEYWAVGQDQDPSHPPVPLILHYDGHDWTPVSPPPIPGQSWLNSVACAGSGNVWAVGAQDHGGAQIGPLIMHFDGSAWTVIDPPATAAPAVLQAVVVLPSGDAYAAGMASSVPADTGYTIPLATRP